MKLQGLLKKSSDESSGVKAVIKRHNEIKEDQPRGEKIDGFHL